jgi:hypothetical protein
LAICLATTDPHSCEAEATTELMTVRLAELVNARIRFRCPSCAAIRAKEKRLARGPASLEVEESSCRNADIVVGSPTGSQPSPLRSTKILRERCPKATNSKAVSVCRRLTALPSSPYPVPCHPRDTRRRQGCRNRAVKRRAPSLSVPSFRSVAGRVQSEAETINTVRLKRLAMQGEHNPIRLHDEALERLLPSTGWREAS